MTCCGGNLQTRNSDCVKSILRFITATAGSARRDLTTLTLVFGIAFFQFLGRFPLMEPDEGRYAEIPREMLERGDFVTPLLNYVKYFEKPPLHYWLNALSLSVFGENEFAARFPGTLCGLLTVLFTYHMGRKLFGRREGMLAALVLGSATGFLVQSRINFIDMTLTFCMTAALGCFLLASRPDEKRKWLYYYLFYIFAALAVLAKGLIGLVLPGAVIFLYLLICRRWRLLKEMRLLTGIPLFLAVAAPWFVLVSLRNPEFARFFFIHEHFERFLTKVHGRYQPFWFFIPILLLTMLPWSFFVPQALAKAWRERKAPSGENLIYLILWAGFIFLFFSKSNSKLIPYILPVFPALALLVGRLFCTILDGEELPARVTMVLATILCIVGLGAMVYPHVATRPDLSPVGGIVAGGIFLAEGVLAFVAVYYRDGQRLFLTLFAGGLLLAVVGPHFFYERISQRRASSKELCLLVRKVAGPDTVVASFGYEQGLPFYAQRRVIVVGGIGELEFGSKQGDQSAWFMDVDRFVPIWDSSRPVVALLRQGDLDTLMSKSKTQVRILGEDSRKLLITNR
ncbi:MAG: glycosyltransferase family 39 protein [Geobacter sp.]|nr:glycosyltransferase family 39 protein [Geobacter sp.]